jgi:hypothetical protein
MAKKSRLTAGEQTQLVLGLLSAEEPAAAQIARRAGVTERTPYHRSAGPERAGYPDARPRRYRQSHFGKLRGGLKLSAALRSMVEGACKASAGGAPFSGAGGAGDRALGVVRKVSTAEPKKLRRKPKPAVPQELVAEIRALAEPYR